MQTTQASTEQKQSVNKNMKKNNCMDIPSDKQPKSDTKILAMAKKKGNLKRETESLLIAAQNNAIRTKHIKARIDKTQQNSKCRLCGDRDETINLIISECSKLAFLRSARILRRVLET